METNVKLSAFRVKYDFYSSEEEDEMRVTAGEVVYSRNYKYLNNKEIDPCDANDCSFQFWICSFKFFGEIE